MTPCDRVRAHMKSCFRGDAVEDHTKHNGKRDANLLDCKEKESVTKYNTKKCM